MRIPVEVSARHVHLSKEVLEVLFGKGYELNVRGWLSQPGQYVCKERVTIVGPRGTIENVSVLGPTREDTQIEVSLTDTRKLGISTEIRESGDICNTSGCKLVGEAGEVELSQGVIVARRHIHMSTEDARKFNVSNGQIVSVCVEDGIRPIVFGGTVVRVSDKYALAMHIDTDEANAGAISSMCYGEIV